MKTPEQAVLTSSPGRLAELIDDETGDDRLWQTEELAAILRHQLQVPIQFELGALPRRDARGVKSDAESNSLLLKSFGDLLAHPQPPVELLRMTKQFAKGHLASLHASLLPKEVASVLYYASIAVARIRCGRRISNLSEPLLRQGLDWCVGQTWLVPEMRELLQECRRDLDAATAGEESP